MTTGRPTEYSEKVLKKAKEYRDNLPENEVVHSVEGLSDYLKLARSTLYKWRDEEGKEEFSDIFDEILAKQAKTLVNKGLEGKFAPTITKVMLTKHGYVDKQDITSADKPIQPLLVKFIGEENGNDGDTSRI